MNFPWKKRKKTQQPKESEKSMSIQLGDPVMIIPANQNTSRSADLKGIVVSFEDKEKTSAVVVWGLPGLELESILPVERLVSIVQ